MTEPRTDPARIRALVTEIRRRVCNSLANGIFGSKTCAQTMISPQSWCGVCLAQQLDAATLSREDAPRTPEDDVVDFIRWPKGSR